MTINEWSRNNRNNVRHKQDQLNDFQIDSTGNKGEIIAARPVVCYGILREISRPNEGQNSSRFFPLPVAQLI